MDNLREPNGGAAAGEERPSRSPSPSSIGPESWERAEKAIQGILFKLLLTTVSEKRRKKVIHYVERVMRTRDCGYKVFPYGSRPLKTYLPDGDIDITVCADCSEDVFLENVLSVLEGEVKNKAAEFVVKDVQLIRSKVKHVKCIVQDIAVDISFSQIGGLCTLCFFEEVLYKFLDYFSKFDWGNYCISLSGPVRISSLPEFVVEAPDNGGGDLLFTSEFLEACLTLYSIPSVGVDLNSPAFEPVYLNIVDPLKENNNLGRSVGKGKLKRIRNAFTDGARELGKILTEPELDIDKALRKFFFNTLDRHGSGQET